MQTHHSLVRVIDVVGDVQQIRVLQLFAQPLQQTHWLVQSDGHGDSGQVLADVVVQDGHDANVAVVRSWGGEGSAAAWITATRVSIASVPRPPASWVPGSSSSWLIQTGHV